MFDMDTDLENIMDINLGTDFYLDRIASDSLCVSVFDTDCACAAQGQVAELLGERSHHRRGLDGHGVIHCWSQDSALWTHNQDKKTSHKTQKNRPRPTTHCERYLSLTGGEGGRYASRYYGGSIREEGSTHSWLHEVRLMVHPGRVVYLETQEHNMKFTLLFDLLSS